ncbi:uncharacterized protein LOC125209952 [Salvia hispanica]|uniref:uncharacterized protein LOC125209952 n=1 Tax=Salvia hispanica TaxID=49212 RepID=UPI00200900D3|nr:uncharacterized protein LOC125209952 [Salvia hispanica]
MLISAEERIELRVRDESGSYRSRRLNPVVFVDGPSGVTATAAAAAATAAKHGHIVVDITGGLGIDSDPLLKPNFSCAVVDTPLVCAVKSLSFECLKLLLEGKADPNFYVAGLSPMQYAAKEGDTKFLEYLIKAKGDPNSSDKDIHRPIEEAALVHDRAAVEVLFPVTEQLAHYPNWTVDGIIEYTHSEEYKKMSQEKLTKRLSVIDFGGLLDAGNKNYYRAIFHYRMASHLDPSNATWVSTRSMWEARTHKSINALLDAQQCFRLKPHCPVPYDRGDNAAAANEIFKKFLKAGLAFSLDPYERKKCHAFRITMFDYFAWLSQMSSAEEIFSCDDDQHCRISPFFGSSPCTLNIFCFIDRVSSSSFMRNEKEVQKMKSLSKQNENLVDEEESSDKIEAEVEHEWHRSDSSMNSPEPGVSSYSLHRKIEQRVETKAVNNKEMTALDVFYEKRKHKLSFAKHLTLAALHAASVPQNSDSDRKVNVNLNVFKERVNTFLVMATLVATVTFAAGFTMPGGYISSETSNELGMAAMWKDTVFHVFVFCDTIAMYTSILAVTTLIWAQLGDITLVFSALYIAVPLLGVALIMMSMAFTAGVTIVLSKLRWLQITVLAMSTSFIALLLLLLILLCAPLGARSRILRYLSYYPFCLLVLVTSTKPNH